MNDVSSHKKHFHFDLLNDYADGILNNRLHEKITAHLQHCDECAETVRSIRYYYESNGDDRESFDNYLEETKTNILSALNAAQAKTEKPTKVGALWHETQFFKIAATLLFIAIPTSLLIYNYQANSAKSLVDGYLSEAYNKPPVARGDSDQIMKLWNDIAVQYENGNYAEAIPGLEQVVAQGSTVFMAHFYTGLCYLYMEPSQPEEAIVHLQEAAAGENPYAQQSLWYLSLAYFKAGEKQLSKETLEQINGYKNEEVRALLKKLED